MDIVGRSQRVTWLATEPRPRVRSRARLTRRPSNFLFRCLSRAFRRQRRQPRNFTTELTADRRSTGRTGSLKRVKIFRRTRGGRSRRCVRGLISVWRSKPPSDILRSDKLPTISRSDGQLTNFSSFD